MAWEGWGHGHLVPCTWAEHWVGGNMKQRNSDHYMATQEAESGEYQNPPGFLQVPFHSIQVLTQMVYRLHLE